MYSYCPLIYSQNNVKVQRLDYNCFHFHYTKFPVHYRKHSAPQLHEPVLAFDMQINIFKKTNSSERDSPAKLCKASACSLNPLHCSVLN